MKICVFLLLLFIHLPSSNACGTGFYATVGNPDPTKGNCTSCLPFCVSCTALLSCETGIDSFKGLDRSVSPQAPLCAFAGASWSGAGYGYSKNLDACDRCVDGCVLCVVDSDVCITCQAGWDADLTNYKCQRAVLGISATNLALTVVVFILNIITCACACKL